MGRKKRGAIDILIHAGKRAPAGFYQASIGKKIAMAVTGTILVPFVIGHFVGNLKVYLGPEEFNHYAEGLRTFGSPFFPRGYLLWIIRVVLLVTVLTHVVSAALLWLQSRRARPVGYRMQESLSLTYASRTMVWGGIALAAFVVFHLMHLTIGNAHPDFVPGDAYHNFVAGFQAVPVSLAYLVAMVPLGFHMYHGIWSAFQTLGANDIRYRSWRRPLALVITLAKIRKFSISFRLLFTVWLHRQGIVAAWAKVFGTAYAHRPMHRHARSCTVLKENMKFTGNKGKDCNFGCITIILRIPGEGTEGKAGKSRK